MSKEGKFIDIPSTFSLVLLSTKIPPPFVSVLELDDSE
ncbi:hypothetical protein RV09_GL002286 [Enterococcus moraviensis]|nr:hypothetical protein RV09_GL002286 [Enterococcus moraviensis]